MTSLIEGTLGRHKGILTLLRRLKSCIEVEDFNLVHLPAREIVEVIKVMIVFNVVLLLLKRAWFLLNQIVEKMLITIDFKIRGYWGDLLIDSCSKDL